MAEIKKHKVTEADWDKVEKHVKGVFDDRKNSRFRRNHERIWKEVDRQVTMEPMQRLTADGKVATKSWHNAIELGELAKASEIIADDVMRIMFPGDRSWIDCHTQIEWPLGPDGDPQSNSEKQAIADGLLRSLMGQQHKDFGLKARFRLSVKEALHHGSFCAEVRFEHQLMVRGGGKVKKVGSPVWVPYSMWNTYPDPSPYVIGTNLFYTGIMILVEYMPMSKLKAMTGAGWIKKRLSKIEKRSNKNEDEDTEDVELIKFKGDIVIERGEGDIYLPNSEVVLANDKLVYYNEADLPYPNVIFAGYERQDVRDPYYTSPIIKQSPTHRMTTIMANKFLDATSLRVEPPIEYDANDPEYVMNGGPDISPGSKTPTRSMGKGFTSLDIGDPRFALDAYTLGLRQMQEGLGVSAMRAGVRDADRETATSANLANQGAEVRTMGFITQLEAQGLLPFLYMQHEFNRRELDEYTFYNDEMHTNDFITAKREHVQEDVHFDVVGSRGVLGEEQRTRKIAETVAFFSGNPLFAPKLNTTPIALEMLRDAGKKNPEEWIKVDEEEPQIPPEVMQQMQQMQQALQQMGEELKQAKSGIQIKTAELELRQKESEADFKIRAAELEMKKAVAVASDKTDRAQILAEVDQAQKQMANDTAIEKQNMLVELAAQKRDFDAKMAKISADVEIAKGKIKATQEKPESTNRPV